MYSLNLAEDNRILSVCVCLAGQTYNNIIDTLPDGDVTDYKYINGEFSYEPLPELIQPQEPTIDDIIDTLLGIKGE